MTRLRAWLRQRATPLLIGLWVTAAVAGWALIVLGVSKTYVPAAFILAGVGLLGVALIAAVGE